VPRRAGDGASRLVASLEEHTEREAIYKNHLETQVALVVSTVVMLLLMLLLLLLVSTCCWIFRRLKPSSLPVLLWNRLVTPQDTHDQESNAPSAPLAK
jgi:hypothetical protein